MYLKSIEMQGFKSFPEKVTIPFDSGITVVVGPNGSGKSNICDAIRWVLGEQSSKTLRGAKMEDVIFNGTQKRGAVGFADVSLMLDNSTRFLNSEYDEVTVTRRYYRSGESEYVINKVPVRLKDVHELFMDTGLGRDGYSVVGQGRVAEILSVKSEDRRQIFEEAAGISKFRYRKTEAERKLEATTENLLRIGDVLNELSARIGPLEQQAKKARAYLDLREQLKAVEVNWFLATLDRLKENFDKVKGSFDAAATTLDLNRKAADDADEEITRILEQARQIDTQVACVKEEIFALQNRRTELQGEIALRKNDIQNNLGAVARIEKDLSDQGGYLEQLAVRRRQAELQLVGLVQEYEQLRSELDELAGKDRDVFRTEARADLDLEQKNVLLTALLSDLSDSRINQSAAEAGSNAANQRLQSLQQELIQKRQTLSELQANCGVQREQLEELQRRAQALCNMEEGYAKKLAARRSRLEQAQQRADSCERAREAKNARLQMLQELARDYEGYGQSVKFVMQQAKAGRLNHVHGPVSTLVSMDASHATALEIALGGAMQHVVVDTEQDAKAAIAALKTANAGRATFLPISTVTGKKLEEESLATCEGFIGLASDLVRCDERYRGIITQLLGRTVVVETIDQAVRIAKQYQYRLRIVTLDGQVVNAGGSMTGGSFNQRTGLFARAQEIEALRAELAKLQEEAAALMQDLSAAREGAQDITAQVDGLKADQAALNEQIIRQGALCDSLEREQAAADQSIEALVIQQHELQEAAEQLLSRVVVETQRDQELQLQIGELEEAIAQTRGNKTQIAQQRASLGERIMERKLAATAMQKDIEAVRAAIAELDERRENSGDRGAQLRAEIASLLQQNEELKEANRQAEALCGTLEQSAADKRTNIEQMSARRIELDGAVTRRQQQSREQRDQLLQLQQEHARLESRLDGLRDEQESVLTRLWEDYELTPITAEALRSEQGTLAQMGSRVKELKGRMKNLGSVNLDSIEEYREVKERFEFLSVQSDDLVKSKEGLLSLIEEMTRQMKQIFVTQFAAINRAFQEVFVELFGGGSASLELCDDEDVLESGIEIKVQPPGKKVSKLSLLSGGEQAFVAIVLLFSILRVRPTPFCVFDEIESALDDVNVARVAKYMRSYSKKTQFIMITHRRGTMEAADLLYGVTMQEKGVSKLLSIHVADMEQQTKLLGKEK